MPRCRPVANGAITLYDCCPWWRRARSRLIARFRRRGTLTGTPPIFGAICAIHEARESLRELAT